MYLAASHCAKPGLFTNTGALFAMLASILRHIVWRNLLAAREPPLHLNLERVLISQVTSMLKTLCLLLECPFYVTEGSEREAAVHEAARR